MMKSGLAMLLLGLSAVSFNAAFSHRAAEPKHGGVAATVSDLYFELVPGDSGAVIYLEDHGKPVSGTDLQARRSRKPNYSWPAASSRPRSSLRWRPRRRKQSRVASR